MAAPKGNNFQALRDEKGRKKLFKSPDEIWINACAYFEWCKENPIMQNTLHGKTGEIVQIPTSRPFTLTGMCIHFGIGTSTWNDYKNKDGYEVFSDIITYIEQIIRNQKFSGAVVGMYNANIIARDLKLAEHTDNKVSGELNVPPVDWVK